jgi:autotransporter-associated beta strand protein
MDFLAGGLAGSGTIQNGGGVERWLYVNTAGNDSFSGTLENGGGAGALGLNKLGSGTLTLSGASTYTGTTTLTGGTLVAANPAALGSTFRLNVPQNSNVTFRYATDGAIADNTVPIGLSTPSTGNTTSLTVISDRATAGAAVDRTMTVPNGSGLGGGTINFTSGANVTSGTPKITFTQVGLGAGSNQTTTLNPVGVDLLLGNTSKFNNNQPQTLELGGTSTGNEVTGVIANGAVLTGTNAVSITKSNTGTWKLSGANTFTGTTTLIDGNLILANTSAVGGTARVNVTNTTGAGPNLVYATDGGDTTVPIGLSTGSAFTVVSGRATSGAAVDRTMTVPGTIGGLGNGTINFISGANVTSGTPRITFTEFSLGAGSGGTTLVNPTTVNLSLGNVTKVINTPNQTLGLGGTSTDNEVTGVISNGLATAVSVTKSNASTWKLSGNSTYGGATNINGGTLLVTGNNSGATGAVNVAAAGTLGGTGTLGGLVTNNGTIAPGTTGTGTLNVASLTLNVGSTLSIDLNTPSNSDLVNISATNGLTISGGSVVVNNAVAGTFPILDYAGTLGGALANLGTPTGPGGFSYSLSDDGSFINLVVSAATANGDWNGDTKVNAADYVTWRKNPSANGNDPAGYVAWRENFSQTAAGGSGLSGTPSAVPEPGALALVGLALGMILSRRRAR